MSSTPAKCVRTGGVGGWAGRKAKAPGRRSSPGGTGVAPVCGGTGVAPVCGGTGVAPVCHRRLCSRSRCGEADHLPWSFVDTRGMIP